MPPEATTYPAPHVEQQFATAEQQREAASLGMWVFLVTELLLFGGLFTTYQVYRALHGDAFTAASRELLVWAGTTNTVVLITSSLTMALAVNAAARGQRRLMIVLLLATMALGFVFLGIKAYEYYSEYVEHHVPGAGFQFDPRFAAEAQIFFSLYFMMTGLHAAHMIAGLCVVGGVVYLGLRGGITEAYNTPVEITGLYWHFVDIVWIFLFPLLYLIGAHLHP
jgi:cytochrome c oxidase subunit 3